LRLPDGNSEIRQPCRKHTLLLALPLVPALVLLPGLGLLLNGTSSVLYGTVPELTTGDRAERAFALFYTGTIGAGAIAPVCYGLLGDRVGVPWATAATAITALLTLPIMLALAPRLTSPRPKDTEFSPQPSDS
jgi:MFS family permease